MAREQNQSMAEVVRAGVDLALALHDRRKRWGRARSMVGTFASGRRDVAEKRDQYLAEAFRK